MLAAVGVARSAWAGEPPRPRAGPYAITLRLPQAGLYAGEEMEIEFLVEDFDHPTAGGGPTPLPWGRIQAQIDMPSMPAMARFEELAHREGVPGVFGVHPTFPHGGDYRLCLTILPPEVQPIGDPRPTIPFAYDFRISVFDAVSSPHPEAAKVKPFLLDVLMTPRHPVAGEPVDLELRVRLANSFELREAVDFEIQHEKLMHLFVISSDGTHFEHEHPEPSGPGVFRLLYRFPAPGRYKIFADVAPRGAGSQVLSATIEVGGNPIRSRPTAPEPQTRAVLAPPDGGLHAGRTVTMEALLTDRAGRPVRDLEPWLGSMAHLMLLHEDTETFAHAHPDEREPGVGRDGRIPFLVRLPKPGAYRGWLQFQRKGRVETVEVALIAER